MLIPTRRWLAKTTTDKAAAATEKLERRSWFRHTVTVRRSAHFRQRWGAGDEGYNIAVHFQQKTKLICVDNTNCKHVRLIGQQSSETHHSSRICPCVAHRVAVSRFRSNKGQKGKQIKPGDIFWFCLFSRRQYNARWSGLITNFDRNTGIILNDQKEPLGTRVMYAGSRHLNHRVYLKAALLANFFV